MNKTIIAALSATALIWTPQAQTAPAPAYTVNISYDVSLIGLSIGSMRMEFKLEGGTYHATAFIQPEGLASTFTSNTVNAVGNGKGVLGAMETFSSWIQQVSPKKTQTVQMQFDKGTPVSVDAQPAYDPSPDAPTEAQKAGTFDPVGGFVAMMLLPSAGAGDTACGTSIPIYDGRRAYAFDMWSGGEIEVTRGAGGYKGKVLYCVASYRRIAGWDARRMAKGSNTKIHGWFAPIGKGPDGGPAFYLPVRLWGDAEVGDAVAVPDNVTINGKPWEAFFAEGG